MGTASETSPAISRFVSLKPRLLLPLDLLLHDFRGKRTGIDFAHTTKLGGLPQCRNQPEQGLPRDGQAGRTAMGWFFGCKLHLLINHKGQIMAFRMTDGSRDDRKPLEAMTTALQGKIFADKGICPRRCWSTSGNGAFTWSLAFAAT